MGRAWTGDDVTGYREWIDGWIAERAAGGEKADCADLALWAIITYAGQHGLHVPFFYMDKVDGKWKWRRASELEFKGNYPRFAAWARLMLGARNLADHVNTRPVPVEGIKAGDLLIFNWKQTETEPNIPFWHTILYVGPDRLWMGNEDFENKPTVPELITADKPRGARYPKDYLAHPDLYAERGGVPSARRWKFFPRDV